MSAEPVGPRQVSGAPAGGRRATALQVGDLAELRAREPEAVAAAAARRARRPLLGSDGRLLIVAADHPARGALGVRDDPEAMASRPELLSRLRTALCRPGVDGVLGTPDVLEDLLLLGDLEGKVVFGSMNRGGLQGASFELDDRFTAYDAAAIAEAGFEGGKMLTRVDLDDPGTARSRARQDGGMARAGLGRVVALIAGRKDDALGKAL